jgi:hypothetical protein
LRKAKMDWLKLYHLLKKEKNSDII